MALLAVPNVSEGRDMAMIDRLTESIVTSGARILDLHSDRIHNRSVFTLTGDELSLVDAAASLAMVASTIDLEVHEGVHPRLGGLDVFPVVPHNDTMKRAVSVARRISEAIATRADLPVYLYGAATPEPPPRELPDLRRGGVALLVRRAMEGLTPDAGPPVIDPRKGVVCVGARDTLIAFNVWLNAPVEAARSISAWLRGPDGPPAVRALAFPVGSDKLSQVSMNLVDPAVTGIDEAFTAVTTQAEGMGVKLRGTEIVGLVPERYLPGPDAEAARMLISPGRSVESALSS